MTRKKTPKTTENLHDSEGVPTTLHWYLQGLPVTWTVSTGTSIFLNACIREWHATGHRPPPGRLWIKWTGCARTLCRPAAHSEDLVFFVTYPSACWLPQWQISEAGSCVGNSLETRQGSAWPGRCVASCHVHEENFSFSASKQLLTFFLFILPLHWASLGHALIMWGIFRKCK